MKPTWAFEGWSNVAWVGEREGERERERKGGMDVFYKWDSVCPSTSGHLLMLYYEPSLVQQIPPSAEYKDLVLLFKKKGWL